MHFYWRVIEELKYLGEIWTIKDPSLLRRYEHWMRKHAESIHLHSGQKRAELIHVPYSRN
jgi:hypothetical protein